MPTQVTEWSDAMFTSLAAAMALFFSAVPKIIGFVLIIVAGFAYWGILLIRNYAWQNPLSASVIVGLLFLVGMSWGEFIFYCPAILITWCALWPAVARWTILEEAKS